MSHSTTTELAQHPVSVADEVGVAFERNLTMERARRVRVPGAIADPGEQDPAESHAVRRNGGAISQGCGERYSPQSSECFLRATNHLVLQQIAVSLFVSEGTVKSHVKHILRKMGAANRTDAVTKYHRLRA